MTAAELASRVDAVQRGRVWTARCPAHDDRRPSLSIGEGRTGNVVVKCHAGCEAAAIVYALGLRMSDLFDISQQPGVSRVRMSIGPRYPNSDEVGSELRRELHRIVSEESERAGFSVAVLSRHRNAARETMNRRYNLRGRNAELRVERPPWHEVDPHALDPAWPACIDAALHVVAARGNMNAEELTPLLDHLPKTQALICRLARHYQRSLAHPAPARNPVAA